MRRRRRDDDTQLLIIIRTKVSPAPCWPPRLWSALAFFTLAAPAAAAPARRPDRLAAARLSRGRLSPARSRTAGDQPIRICRDARILGVGPRARRGACPPTPAKRALVAEARALEAAVARQGAFRRGRSALAHALGAHLLAAYPVPLAPSRRPTSARGARSIPAELRELPWRHRRCATPRWRGSSTRRRSPSPTAAGRASAACSRSIR